jgi:putative transposase
LKPDRGKTHRRSIRLKEYDYAQPGGYFVTIVTFQRECLFGKIIDAEMQLNDYGRVTQECWHAIPEHLTNVELGAYVIMPNHVHGIVLINGGSDDDAPDRRRTIYRAPTKEQFGKPVIGSIPTIVRTFKAAVTRRLGREYYIANIWQRNYYEHVIRNEDEWDRIHRYLESNPANWDSDDKNLTNK